MSNNNLSANQLRQLYLDFFAHQDHAIAPSSLLVPENDPTTLFTTAGMQQMMPYLLGQPHPQGKRVTNSQKCFRAQDIEEIGDNRHTTFFEMLGNWSLGDYFKKEQLRWLFTFLVDVVGLDPKKLFVTVFSGSKEYGIELDQESVEIWQELFAEKGVKAKLVTKPEEIDIDQQPNARIFSYSASANWWSRAGEPEKMPQGEPGGPDSEVFYDFGPELKLHENSVFADKPCHVNCDCGRFLEIGNSVFMQYQKTDSGLLELSQKNIDFGGGLERILAASWHQPDIFKTDLFWPIIDQLQQLTGKNYEQHKQSFRVIADHLKAATMLIADGVNPSNKDQGYVVRRLLRRAIRQENLLSNSEQLLPKLVATVVQIYQQPYPHLVEQQDKIIQAVATETEKFSRTLIKGLREFNKLTQKSSSLSGADAYYLYETYGFPKEVLLEEATLQQIKISDNFAEEFLQAKSAHENTSKSGSTQKFKGGLADHTQRTTQYHTTTHLLHQALRQVLGDHVQQKGSNITDQRMRFDFTHPQPLSDQEIAQVEELINQWIVQDLPVNKIKMNKQEALALGALAFFAERYPNEVTVYVIGQVDENLEMAKQITQNKNIISKELCGGPHVSSTGEIGQIEIFKEKSASAGVRRVYVRVKE